MRIQFVRGRAADSAIFSARSIAIPHQVGIQSVVRLAGEHLLPFRGQSVPSSCIVFHLRERDGKLSRARKQAVRSNTLTNSLRQTSSGNDKLN